MPYSHVTRTAYGADALAYARGHGVGHNGETVRNIFTAGVNMLPDEVLPFEEQMQPLWDRADPRHTTQIDRFIVSFATSELDPDDPGDLCKALDIGCELARTNAPDCQSAVFVQTDGVGHKVHLHILTNDVTLRGYKGIDPKAYAHWHFKPLVDKTCAKYFELAQPETAPERVTRAVRGARIANAQIKAVNREEVQQAIAEDRPVDHTVFRPLKYIWQGDLRERIRLAAMGAWDEDSFARRLRADGVELVPHKAKDGTLSYVHPATRTQPAHYKYELVDVSGFDGPLPLTLRSKSFKMGANYQPEGIAKLFTAPPQPEKEEGPLPLFLPGAKSLQAIAAEQEEKERREREARKERERQELVKARRAMTLAIWPVFAASMGWDTSRPDDPDEAERRKGLWLDECDDFQRWRVRYRAELKAKDKKLAPIYDTDKETGAVSIIEENVLNQYSIYLYRKQQEDAQVARDREAERQRRKLREQQAALEAEERHSAAHIRRREDDREYNR